MTELIDYEVWFVTGSQHLYGDAALRTVAEHSQTIARGLNESGKLPVKVVFKAVVTTPQAIYDLCQDANHSKNCLGLITWMHTFSPAKMWIAGLKALQKPFVHLHTQFSRDLPWSNIDMDFMNLNQSAHGDREFGFIASRMHLRRKVIVGFWQDQDVLSKLEAWLRAARAWQDLQGVKIARFGDNIRDVAVTEGDKVAAQIQFGFSVYGYGVGDLVQVTGEVTDAQLDKLLAEYDDTYVVQKSLQPGGEQRHALRQAARIELGMRAFLEVGSFNAFTTTFEDLHGLDQLPGLAVQRLMADGYGFGAEGDWKTAALVRALKVMSTGLSGGTSFMEDYTYDFNPKNAKVLGAHMLEVCSSIADGKPSLEIHPLSIGGRSDPPRLVFNVRSGPAINVTMLDMGDRFRMVVNKVDVVQPDQPLTKLPVARAVWIPRPDLKTAAAAWILAGGAHHTAFSEVVSDEILEDFAEMADMEYLLIDENMTLPAFKKELQWNEAYRAMRSAVR